MSTTRATTFTSDSRLLRSLRWLCLGAALAAPVLWQNMVGEGGLLHGREVLRCESEWPSSPQAETADEDTFEHHLVSNPLVAADAADDPVASQ
jgi:hypothetical protein